MSAVGDPRPPTTVDGTSTAFVANKRRIRGERRSALGCEFDRRDTATASISTRGRPRPATALELPGDAEPADDLPPTETARISSVEGRSRRGTRTSVRPPNPPFREEAATAAAVDGMWVARFGGVDDRMRTSTPSRPLPRVRVEQPGASVARTTAREHEPRDALCGVPDAAVQRRCSCGPGRTDRGENCRSIQRPAEGTPERRLVRTRPRGVFCEESGTLAALTPDEV